MADKSASTHHKEHKDPAPENHVAAKDASAVKENTSPEKELEQLKEQNKQLNERFLRLAADFDNARKRWEKDKEETIKYGTYKILKDLIVFVDEMERAIEMMKDQGKDGNAHKTFVEGVTMTCNKLKDLLLSEGVKEMNPLGEKFDPYKHEILSQEEKDKISQPVISEVFQKGYLFNDRLLRTAKVKVCIPKDTETVSREEIQGKQTEQENNNDSVNEQA